MDREEWSLDDIKEAMKQLEDKKTNEPGTIEYIGNGLYRVTGGGYSLVCGEGFVKAMHEKMAELAKNYKI